jgi:glycosyltransferase involved in cell wall biosynthesis
MRHFSIESMQKRLRILHIINELSDGGAEIVLLRLIKSSPLCEHMIISFTKNEKYDHQFISDNSRIIHLGKSKKLTFFFEIPQIIKLIKRTKPDVIQTWLYKSDLFGGIAGRLAGHRKIVWGIHNSSVDIKTSGAIRFLIIRINALLSHFIPAEIIYASKSGKVNHENIGFKKKRSCVINNGYPTDIFHPNENKKQTIKKQLEIARDTMVIGNVARLDRQKDHPTLLKSLFHLKTKNINFVCLLAGRGLQESHSLNHLIKKLGLESNVRVLGPRSDIALLMTTFDIYVCSSYTEAFPNVVCEAMATGVPCISTDVGDVRSIIGNTGWIVPARSPKAISYALECAISNTEDRIRRGTEARERIKERFSINKMASSYFFIWNSIHWSKS